MEGKFGGEHTWAGIDKNSSSLPSQVAQVTAPDQSETKSSVDEAKSGRTGLESVHVVPKRPTLSRSSETKSSADEAKSGRTGLESVHVVPKRPTLSRSSPLESKMPPWARNLTHQLRLIGRVEKSLTTDQGFRRQDGVAAEDYLTSALQTADGTLETAHNELAKLANQKLAPNPDQLSATITALSDTKLWDQLLRAAGLGGNTEARNAANNLAEIVSRMSPHTISANSLSELLDEINTLRRIISSVQQQHSASLSVDLVRTIVSSTRVLATEVTVGLAAMYASTETAGTQPERIAVICSAIGISAGVATREIWDGLKRAASDRTVRGSLRKNHHEMCEMITFTQTFSDCLASYKTNSVEDQALLSNLLTATRFQVNHIMQLCHSAKWISSERYRSTLVKTKLALEELNAAIDDGDYTLAGEAMERLKLAKGGLLAFDQDIDRLK